MRQIISKIWSSPSVRNVGKLLSANIIAQAIGLLIYPVLTRMYAPEDFALLSLFTSIVGVAVLLGNAEYQYAIVLPKEDTEARALVHLSTIITLIITCVLCLSLPFSGYIANLFKAPELARWWWAMPACVLALCGWNILSYWYIRRKAFTRISGYQISQSVFSASGKIGFGAIGWLHGGQILATTIAPILSLIASIALAWKKHICELLSFRREDVQTVAKEYANFPKFNLPRAFVNSLGQSLPIWLLTPCFGLEKVGYLSLAMMAAFVPLNIIARACYQVMYQQVAEKVQQQKPIQQVIMRFIVWTLVVMLVGLSGIYFVVPQLVTFLFGADWLESAHIIRRLLPYLLLVPVCGTLCFLSDVFAKQKIAMWMETGYVAMMALTLFLGIRTGSFETSVSLFAWLGFSYLFIQLMWFVSLVRRYQRTL